MRSIESGFSRKSKAPELSGAHRGLDVAVAGDHDDFGMIFALYQLLQRFQAVDARKPDIEQHDVGRFVPQEFQTLFAAAGEQGLIAFIRQHAFQRAADLRLVIHDQNGLHLDWRTAA